MTVSAKVIFAGRPPRSLPQFADLMSRHLRDGDISEATLQEASLSTLVYDTEGLNIALKISIMQKESVLTLSLTMPKEETGLRRLATLCFHLARAVEVEALVWHGTDLRIPGADFVAGLAACFETDSRTVTAVAPRRVRRGVTTDVRPLPSLPSLPTLQARHSDRRYDAHVVAYEAHLRRVLTAPIQPVPAPQEGLGARLLALTGFARRGLEGGDAQAAS